MILCSSVARASLLIIHFTREYLRIQPRDRSSFKKYPHCSFTQCSSVEMLIRGLILNNIAPHSHRCDDTSGSRTISYLARIIHSRPPLLTHLTRFCITKSAHYNFSLCLNVVCPYSAPTHIRYRLPEVQRFNPWARPF